ncbi:hypothetical protein JYT13_01600 [Mariprofundus ferrooxydans]|nr:hypothetical protein [Mariprofundus ferrooxydans]
MNKTIRYTLTILMGLGFTAITPAQASDMEVSGDLGVYSQYMWRGIQQAAGASSVQGDLNLDTGTGLSANAWFASLNSNSTEFDFTIDYSGEVSGISYSAGVIAYTFLNQAALNANEVYIGLGYGPISASYYYAVSGSTNKNAYADVVLSHSIGGFDMSADFGFYLPSNTVADPTAFPTTKNELGHIDLAISKDLELEGITFTPSFMVSFPTYTGAPNNSTQFVGGLNAAF